MTNSTVSTKPTKPYPEFPLFPHATKRWAKKINGKLHYFGPWSDPFAALQKYVDQQDDLRAGRISKVSSDGLTVHRLCNEFLVSKELRLESGDIAAVTFSDYRRACGLVIDAFGKSRLVAELETRDFERLRTMLSNRYDVHRLGNTVQRIRSLFNYAFDAGLLEKPVRYGRDFRRPPKRSYRLRRQEIGSRAFDRTELRTLINAADIQLKAMILLGINCGFGNCDCGRLPRTALNLKTGWVDYPRPKTGISRRCRLWPETVDAVNTFIAVRPSPKRPEHSNLVFITKYGDSWAKDKDDNPISKEMRKLLDRLELYRPGLGFYALRHTFATIAGGSLDQVAVDFIMGHVDTSMAAEYRERIDDGRIVNVVDHVRKWMFPKRKLK